MYLTETKLFYKHALSESFGLFGEKSSAKINLNKNTTKHSEFVVKKDTEIWIFHS